MECAEAIALVKGHIVRELLLRNEYLAAENKILKSTLEGRVAFTGAEKVRLAKIGHEIGRLGLRDASPRSAAMREEALDLSCAKPIL
jgi:hypothetical protein